MPWTKVYVDKAEFENAARLQKDGLRGLTYKEAIREAVSQLMEADRRVFVLGEGVDDPGGIFGTTAGLVDRFGKDRVLDLPIAENSMTGVAIGAAMAGMRPVFVHMRMDFLPMCMDQILNHAAKWHYMTGGNVNVPLVIRSIIGRGWGSAAQHSQALHALFTHMPGLKVVMPSTPYDAKGLLVSSIEDGNPIMFIEHRWLYDTIGHVPAELYRVPIGKGIIRRSGSALTIVALSHMVYETQRALKGLPEIDAELIDPRALKPLDEELIVESVKKTGRLLIVDAAWRTGGAASEIAAVVSEKAFKYLKAPVRRLCLPDVPTPSSPVLEDAFYLKLHDIESAIKALMNE